MASNLPDMTDQFDTSTPQTGGSLPDLSDQFDTTNNEPTTSHSNTGSKWSTINSQYDSKYNLVPGFLDALGGHESGNDITAKNKGSSAYGQFQMTDAAWKDQGIDPRSKAVNNPNVQADAAAKMFSNILNNKANGDYELALRMYYKGPNASHASLYDKDANAYVNDPRFKPFLTKQQPTQQNQESLPDMSDQFDSVSDTGSTEPEQQAQEAPQATTQGEWSGYAGYLQPTARAITGAAVSVANIPSELADMSASTLSWLGNKVGIGDGTYRPAPRVTTGDVEQGLGLQEGSLTPQSTSEKLGAATLPFMFGGVEKGAQEVATKAPSIAEKVGNSLINNLSQSVFGTLAQHSDKDDPLALAADLSINTVGGSLFEGIVGNGVKAVFQPSNSLEKLSSAVSTSQKLSEQVTKAKNDLTKADLKYTIGLRKQLPEKEVSRLRSDYLEAESNLESLQKAHDEHLINSGLGYQQGNKVISKAPYLASRTDVLNDLNTKGANVGIGDVGEQLKSNAGESSPLLTRYNIKPNVTEKLSNIFDNNTLGRLSEIIGVKVGDQAGKNADAAHKALQSLGSGIADKVANPDSVGWQSLLPVIKDLRSRQFESAEATIKGLRTEMTPQKAFEELGMTYSEFEQYHKTLDDLNTMRKFMANSPSNRTSRTIQNITGRILAHAGLFHATGPIGVIGVPLTKMAASKLISSGKKQGLRDLNAALKGQYSKPAILPYFENTYNNLTQITKRKLQASDDND